MLQKFLPLLILAIAAESGAGQPGETTASVYAPLSAQDVRDRLTTWVAEQGVDDPETLTAIGGLWSGMDAAPAAQQLFDLTVQNPQQLLKVAVLTAALCSKDLGELVAACRLRDDSRVAPDMTPLDRPDRNPFIIANVRLHIARYLTQARLYDEALLHWDAIPVDQVIDPATYFFYRAVCEHQLGRKQEALATLHRLLEQTVSVPDRFTSVANLMRYDLLGYREKSLDEVSRKMSDVERRLDLGRGGAHVQKIEEEIVAALDEMIKQIEEQSQMASSSGMAAGNQNQPTSPAGDSRIKGAPAPGRVDEKDIGHKTGWGDLPPKEETKARNLINRNFPAHYREAIDQYFKKLANRRAAK